MRQSLRGLIAQIIEFRGHEYFIIRACVSAMDCFRIDAGWIVSTRAPPHENMTRMTQPIARMASFECKLQQIVEDLLQIVISPKYSGDKNVKFI